MTSKRTKFQFSPIGRQPSQELVTLSKNITSTIDVFYAVHITPAGSASDILKLDPPWLKATPCRVFNNKELLYFFLMRPLFRLREGDIDQTLISHFPVAFVFEPDKSRMLAHAAPFDTGAAATGRYDSKYSPGSYIEDYLLDPNLESVAKFISWSCEDLEKYFDGHLKNSLIQDIPNFMSIAQSWLQIAQMASPWGNQTDLRGAAIEIAYDSGFPVASNVKLVIVPDEFLQDKVNRKNQIIIDILDGRKIPYETYEWKSGSRPNDSLNKINGVLRDFYKKKGVF